MKHLFSLLLLFFLSSQLAFALTVAEAEPNSVCADAQLLTDMDGITTDANLEVGPGYIDKNVDTTDIYTFTIDANGTLDFYISATNTIDVYMGAAACGTNPLVLNDADSHTTSININNGDTITIRLEGKNDDYTYGFDLVFKEAVDPTANEDSADTWVDTPIDIDVTANDTDDGNIDKTTVDITSGVTHGSTSIDAVTGVVTYTPDPGYSGTDGFKYRVQDNIGNWSLEVDVLILVKVPSIPAENCDTGTENDYRDFCLRKQTMLPGNMLTIGNTVLVAPDSDGETDENPSADCSTYTNGDYIDDATVANNNFKLCAYHHGGAGEPAATTAVMVMPDANNSIIEWAGLYWQALVEDNVTIDGHNIRFKNGTDAYESITYDKLNYLSSGFSNTNAYAAFKDVTTILQTNNWKDGNYTVADIPVVEGQIAGLGTYGAWSLVVIYRNGNESIRSFSVFDGWQRIDDGSNDNVPIAISGFYTPKAGDINASVSVFTAEGDKHITGDILTVEDQTNGNAEVTLTKVANNTFHSGIYGVPQRSPNPTNNQGIDIHTYALGNVNGGVDVLAHEQTDLTFRFKSSGDYYWPSMINFSTEVYTPSFCYDYAYKQNGVYFTETNPDVLRDPYITGTVINGDDVEVTLYILNREDSDIKATNLSLSINDINTTQAVYKRETVEILNPEEVVPVAVADSSLVVSDSDINNIQFEDVAGGQYFYTYYTLTPNLPGSLGNEMNISLNANFTYDLVLPTPSGGEVVIPSTSSAGGTNLPLCAAGGAYITKAAWDIFNVVDTDVYSQGEYYNIPTQVVRRVGNFSVVAYDENSSNVNNIETPELNSTTLVGIDLIDAGSFQSVQSACNEASTSKGITDILWMAFDNSHTIDLKQEIAEAIADHRLQINSVDEYFPNAVQNAAFRISYLRVNNADEDLVKTEDAGGGNLKLLNFTELVQDIGECKQPVKKFEDPNNNLTTTLVPVACANAGNAGLNPFEMQRCMECLFGYNTDHICSRDNFSIRPESFNVKINDTNQTFPAAVSSRLEDGITGVAAPSGAILDIAAGYRYHFEVNATSHVGNEAVPGYSRYFNPFFPQDFNATLLWEPTNAAVNPFCNDTNNTSIAFNMINGEINALGDHNNVGEYRFNIVDKGWTRGDWDPAYMQHHADNPTYFVGGATGTDCIVSSAVIVSNATATDATGATLQNINGCNIDSNNHDNDDANIRYRDYNMVLHPYDFNVTAVNFNKGMNNLNIPDDSTSYVYMNNVSDDTNMSLRYTGQIRAVGAANVNVSNFVANCYAETVDLSLGTSNLTISPLPLTYRLQERNITGQIFSDTNGSSGGAALLPPVQILSTNFTKDYQGTSDMNFNFNITRTVNNPINPVVLTYADFNVTCNTPGNCQSNADLSATHEPRGEIDSNATITHIYGRVHSPRQRVANPNPAANITATIPLYYEFYCNGATGCTIGTYAANPALSPIGLLSPDDVRWYRQDMHTLAPDGNATATSPRSAADSANITTSIINTVDPFTQTASYTYNGNKGYPYKATIELFAPTWLIHNRFNAAATVNDFELEFFSTGQFAGQDQSNVNVDANTSINVNRRISW